MPSLSLDKWNGERAVALDEIESAHTTVGGTERGRRYATQQINYAYTTLLSGHFQGYCRNLHSECADLIATLVPLPLYAFVRQEFSWQRSLDRGNPHPGAIGSDFNRLGIDFWPTVIALDARNDRRRDRLQQLVNWRNAIAHQSFETVAPSGTASIRLARVRGWRRTLDVLARSFELAMYNYLRPILGADPW